MVLGTPGDEPGPSALQLTVDQFRSAIAPDLYSTGRRRLCRGLG